MTKTIKMPVYHLEKFIEFPHGEFLCHRYDFSVKNHDFLIIFAPVDITDAEYHAYRCEEVGFQVPVDSYDVKFDRIENFESGDFYAPPAKGNCGGGRAYLNELADALETIITLHCSVYRAKAYFAIAETDKLKRFYDRILQKTFDEVLSDVTTDLGEEGKGYAFKTRYY
ncbi:hypothetical protein [Serratia marcescens]|uniref:hypothetical protein n=1 Tax=Serratia marcescens TaxID=615 RepID=UPI001E42DB88|nr:hypothetical protein [Serratia marcescens]